MTCQPAIAVSNPGARLLLVQFNAASRAVSFVFGGRTNRNEQLAVNGASTTHAISERQESLIDIGAFAERRLAPGLRAQQSLTARRLLCRASAPGHIVRVYWGAPASVRLGPGIDCCAASPAALACSAARAAARDCAASSSAISAATSRLCGRARWLRDDSMPS